MNKKILISENKKSIKTESNYKAKKFNKKENSFGTLKYTKRITLSKFLLKKRINHAKEKNNNKNLLIKKKSLSYSKREKFPLINIKNKKTHEKKQELIISYYIMDIQFQEPNEKEKIIKNFLNLQDEINLQNEELNLLKDHCTKLQDINLTYKTIIEKILNIENNNTEENNDINSKNGKKILKEKQRTKILKLQIENYDKKIEKKK